MRLQTKREINRIIRFNPTGKFRKDQAKSKCELQTFIRNSIENKLTQSSVLEVSLLFPSRFHDR